MWIATRTTVVEWFSFLLAVFFMAYPFGYYHLPPALHDLKLQHAAEELETVELGAFLSADGLATRDARFLQLEHDRWAASRAEHLRATELPTLLACAIGFTCSAFAFFSARRRRPGETDDSG